MRLGEIVMSLYEVPGGREMAGKKRVVVRVRMRKSTVRSSSVGSKGFERVVAHPKNRCHSECLTLITILRRFQILGS